MKAGRKEGIEPSERCLSREARVLQGVVFIQELGEVQVIN